MIHIDLIQLKAESCKRDFYFFVREFIDVIEPNADSFIWNWHIEYLCKELQIVAKWVIDKKEKEYDLIINIAPATTKSTLVSRMLPVWIWINDDTRKIATSTINNDTTKEFATTSRDLILSEKFQSYFPNIKIREDKNEKHFYETINGGRRFAFSTFGKKIGKHNDLIIEDDAHTYDEMISETKMNAVIRSYKNLQSRKTDKNKTPYILVMQRLGQSDLTDYILNQKLPIKHIVLPAELNEYVNPPELKNNYIGNLLDINRLSKKTLEREKIIFGERYYAEFNQNPTPNEENLMYPILIEEDFNINEVVSKCFISASFSDLKDEGMDSYATIYTALYKGRIYVLDVIYNTLTNSDNEDRLIHNTSKYQIQKTFIEKNNQQSYLKTNIEPNLRDITDFRPIWTKDNKIELMKSKSHYIRYYVWQKQHENHEYQKAKEHIKKFPRNGKAKDDGIEDVLSKSQKYFSQNRELLEQLINKI